MDKEQAVRINFFTVDNHWDKLPPEIQEHIWNYKTRLVTQEAIQKARWKRLCKEIRQYGELRNRWGLGLIHVSRHQYELRVRQEIWGSYHHEFQGDCEKYLGETFKEALERVDDERIGIQFGYDLA